MQQLKLTNDTIFKKTKMRSLKVYNIFWLVIFRGGEGGYGDRE